MPANIAADSRTASTANPPAGDRQITRGPRTGAPKALGNVIGCRQ